MIVKKKNLTIFLFFILYFVLGLTIFKDYGIGIEEHFQRQNGFFWLKSILKFLNFDTLSSLADTIYLQNKISDPYLPDPNIYNFYGIIFDTPLALLELLLNKKEISFFFHIRHLVVFIFFFLSSIFFYRILKNRFKNQLLVFLGILIYCFTPRIFGDSFHNNKDIIFLSFVTISFFYLFKLIDKFNLKTLFLFSLFSAFATSTRILGIFLPMIFILFIFFELLSNKILLKDLFVKFFLVFFLYIIILYLHYPYIWQLNINNLLDWFKVFFIDIDYKVLFNGEYYHIKHLPKLFLLNWIAITTPVYILFLFLISYFIIFKRLFNRILTLRDQVQPFNDLWRSNREKKDLIIFFSLNLFLIYSFVFNPTILGGWRYMYFLHVFIVYISLIIIDILLIYFRKSKFKKNFLIFINFILVSLILKTLLLYHPYQSLYFNNFINKENVQKFPVDISSLSRFDGIREIISINKNSTKIMIANSSWTPLHNGQDLLPEESKIDLIFVGQEYNKANYIYSNFIYEFDPSLSKKYNIPNNFKEIKNKKIGDLLIYSVYKKVD